MGPMAQAWHRSLMIFIICIVCSTKEWCLQCCKLYRHHFQFETVTHAGCRLGWSLVNQLNDKLLLYMLEQESAENDRRPSDTPTAICSNTFVPLRNRRSSQLAVERR
jgi:hypothetical protein